MIGDFVIKKTEEDFSLSLQNLRQEFILSVFTYLFIEFTWCLFYKGAIETATNM